MKYSCLVSAVAALFSVVNHAHAQDWSGAYVGGLYANHSGDFDYSDGGEFTLGGDTFGGFAGYNVQNGSIVFGGELAYTFGDIVQTDNSPIFHFSDMLDIKGRVGYAMGDALFFATAGWSFSTWNEASFTAPANGLNAGLGLDYMIGDSAFIGAEYVFGMLMAPGILTEIPWTA